jgi:O-antigen/teichoic acid export membrane protein
MATAVPAMSEMGTSGTRAGLFQVSTSLTQLLLILSGAVACVVLVLNGPFVAWWVGPDRFAGDVLTGLMVATMLLRHWNAAAAYTLFCLGHERRVSITTVVDGLVSVIVTAALLPWLGVSGAPFGSITGLVAVSLPGNLRALAREEGVSIAVAIRPLRRWFSRLVPTVAALLVALKWWPMPALWTGAVAGSLVAIGYTLLMMPVALSPPLGSMLPRLRPWISGVLNLSRVSTGNRSSDPSRVGSTGPSAPERLQPTPYGSAFPNDKSP